MGDITPSRSGSDDRAHMNSLVNRYAAPRVPPPGGGHRCVPTPVWDAGPPAGYCNKDFTLLHAAVVALSSDVWPYQYCLSAVVTASLNLSYCGSRRGARPV